MATLTALALLAGSAALAGGSILATNMDTPQEPAEQPPVVLAQQPASVPVQEPASVPVQEPASVPAEQPASGATAPVLPAQPGDEMAGGAIGRPPWGKISSDVVIPQAGDTVQPAATISSVLGIKEDPVQLRNELMSLERQIETANFDVLRYTEMISEINKLYVVERAKFITELSKSKQAETTAAIYQKKLNSQGQQKNKGDPEIKAKQAEIDKASPGSEERKRLEKEKQDMMQNKPASEAEIELWTTKFSKATAEKVEADDDKTEAERQKNKFGTQLQDLRTKQDEKEKLAKELILKRAVLLGRLNIVLTANVKKDSTPADWDARTKRFAKADKERLDAETRLKQFYSDTWLPLQNQPSQEQFRPQFETLTRQWKNARAELELARAALTAVVPESSVSSAASDFMSFVAEVNDITQNAVKTNGTIRDDYVHVNGTMRGYPNAVMELKNYAAKPKLAAAADMYYQIAKMDTQTLIRNTPRILSFFEKILGSTLRAPESEARPMPSIGRDITKVVLKDFIQTILAYAANSVILYPGAVTDEDPQAKVYSQLREKTNEFVDTQIYFINKMFKNIKQARKGGKLSDINIKNVIELETKAKLVYPILEGVPAMGQCARIFKPSTLEMLRTGKRNGKDILTEVFENPTLKDEFLNEIGFVKISNFLEAQEFGKQPGINPADAIDLIKKAAFEEYTKNVERLAYEQPGRQSFARVGGDWEFLNAMNGIGPLTSQTLNQIIPLPGGGIPLPIEQLAQRLRTQANLHRFVPGVFLESNRLAPGPTVGRRTSLEPISEFRNACEIDGNVGSGKEEADRIIAILDRLRDMEIQVKEKPSKLLNLIDKLTKNNKINLVRPDQAEAISALNQKGFQPPYDTWLIMKVAMQDRKLNFLQTFLTFRSSLFRTIPYDDTVVYDGKNTNTREVYSNLVFDEIQKMPSFDIRSEVEKASFPSDDDWKRLSADFNLNFVIFNDENGIGRSDIRAATRQNTLTYYIFKERNNRYFPIRMNATPVGAPGLPRGEPGAPIDTFNRGILGGAIDGIEIPVLLDVKPPTVSLSDTTKQAYNKFIQPWHSHDMSCITNRGKKTFYENVTEGIRQENCVIKLGKLKLQLCMDAGVSGRNNLGRGGFKDAFCAVVKESDKVPEGTKVALLYYRKSGDIPDEPESLSSTDIVFTQQPHTTEEEFLKEIEPSLKRQEQAAKLNIAPQLYSYGFVNKVGGFAVVEFVNGQSLLDIFNSKEPTQQITEEQILVLLQSFVSLAKINITQKDQNASNFIWKDGRFIFIDDLTPLYKPGTNPTNIVEYLRETTSTLKSMIRGGSSIIEKDVDKFLTRLYNYKFTDKASFEGRYDADTTIVKNDFHNKIFMILANAIPDAITFIGKPGKPTAKPTSAPSSPIVTTPTAPSSVPTSPIVTTPTAPLPPTTAPLPPTTVTSPPTTVTSPPTTVPEPGTSRIGSFGVGNLPPRSEAREASLRALRAPRNAPAVSSPPQISRRAREALGVEDDDDKQTLPPLQPTPTAPRSKAYSRRARAALLDESETEGGARWRRSKPSRYTRRKF